MFYYLYQITNKVNGKIYVGVHKTRNLDDGYMGSGRIIRSAIQKHGLSNFSKVILETFENAEAMYAREKEVVNEEFLLREDTYNLRRGGNGGFDYINKIVSKEQKAKFGKMGGHVTGNLGRNIGRKRSEYSKMKISDSINALYKSGHQGSFTGKKHTEETKRKIGLTNSNYQSGCKNSQFGSMWITNDIESIKIKKTDVIPNGWRKGRIIFKK